ncbi:hypothetical protein SNEBB_000419 [Seison nebaliae]|nr:hypothetical protein SNEBB_000419 [Seison nebaliae]
MTTNENLRFESYYLGENYLHAFLFLSQQMRQNDESLKEFVSFAGQMRHVIEQTSKNFTKLSDTAKKWHQKQMSSRSQGSGYLFNNYQTAWTPCWQLLGQMFDLLATSFNDLAKQILLEVCDPLSQKQTEYQRQNKVNNKNEKLKTINVYCQQLSRCNTNLIKAKENYESLCVDYEKYRKDLNLVSESLEMTAAITPTTTNQTGMTTIPTNDSTTKTSTSTLRPNVEIGNLLDLNSIKSSSSSLASGVEGVASKDNSNNLNNMSNNNCENDIVDGENCSPNKESKDNEKMLETKILEEASIEEPSKIQKIQRSITPLVNDRGLVNGIRLGTTPPSNSIITSSFGSMRKPSMTFKQLDKIEDKIIKAGNDYKCQVDKYRQLQEQYMSLFGDSAELIQENTTSFLSPMQKHLVTFLKGIDSHLNSCNAISSNVIQTYNDLYDGEKLLNLFISETQTGNEISKSIENDYLNRIKPTLDLSSTLSRYNSMTSSTINNPSTSTCPNGTIAETLIVPSQSSQTSNLSSNNVITTTNIPGISNSSSNSTTNTALTLTTMTNEQQTQEKGIIGNLLAGFFGTNQHSSATKQEEMKENDLISLKSGAHEDLSHSTSITGQTSLTNDNSLSNESDFTSTTVTNNNIDNIQRPSSSTDASKFSDLKGDVNFAEISRIILKRTKKKIHRNRTLTSQTPPVDNNTSHGTISGGMKSRFVSSHRHKKKTVMKEPEMPEVDEEGYLPQPDINPYAKTNLSSSSSTSSLSNDDDIVEESLTRTNRMKKFKIRPESVPVTEMQEPVPTLSPPPPSIDNVGLAKSGIIERPKPNMTRLSQLSLTVRPRPKTTAIADWARFSSNVNLSSGEPSPSNDSNIVKLSPRKSVGDIGNSDMFSHSMININDNVRKLKEIPKINEQNIQILNNSTTRLGIDPSPLRYKLDLTEKYHVEAETISSNKMSIKDFRIHANLSIYLRKEWLERLKTIYNTILNAGNLDIHRSYRTALILGLNKLVDSNLKEYDNVKLKINSKITKFSEEHLNEQQKKFLDRNEANQLLILTLEQIQDLTKTSPIDEVFHLINLFSYEQTIPLKPDEITSKLPFILTFNHRQKLLTEESTDDGNPFTFVDSIIEIDCSVHNKSLDAIYIGIIIKYSSQYINLIDSYLTSLDNSSIEKMRNILEKLKIVIPSIDLYPDMEFVDLKSLLRKHLKDFLLETPSLIKSQFPHILNSQPAASFFPLTKRLVWKLINLKEINERKLSASIRFPVLKEMLLHSLSKANDLPIDQFMMNLQRKQSSESIYRQCSGEIELEAKKNPTVDEWNKINESFHQFPTIIDSSMKTEMKFQIRSEDTDNNRLDKYIPSYQIQTFNEKLFKLVSFSHNILVDKEYSCSAYRQLSLPDKTAENVEQFCGSTVDTILNNNDLSTDS